MPSIIPHHTRVIPQNPIITVRTEKTCQNCLARYPVTTDEKFHKDRQNSQFSTDDDADVKHEEGTPNFKHLDCLTQIPLITNDYSAKISSGLTNSTVSNKGDRPVILKNGSLIIEYNSPSKKEKMG